MNNLPVYTSKSLEVELGNGWSAMDGHETLKIFITDGMVTLSGVAICDNSHSATGWSPIGTIPAELAPALLNISMCIYHKTLMRIDISPDGGVALYKSVVGPIWVAAQASWKIT